jgi:hypothetical protein
MGFYCSGLIKHNARSVSACFAPDTKTKQSKNKAGWFLLLGI